MAVHRFAAKESREVLEGGLESRLPFTYSHMSPTCRHLSTSFADSGTDLAVAQGGRTTEIWRACPINFDKIHLLLLTCQESKSFDALLFDRILCLEGSFVNASRPDLLVSAEAASHALEQQEFRIFRFGLTFCSGNGILRWLLKIEEAYAKSSAKHTLKILKFLQFDINVLTKSFRIVKSSKKRQSS